MPKERLFLERRGYRLRRLMDVVRFLPLVGLFFWLVPLMWPIERDNAGSVATSTALVYIFGIWISLCGFAFLLWRRTKAVADQDVQARADREPS